MVATVVAFVIAALFRAWRAGRSTVHPVAAGLDPGDEPPALVNLLTHRFRVTREAAPATVLDLAQRGIIDIDEVGPGLSVVRLGDAADLPLAAHEVKVVEALTVLAVDGEVPAEAGSLGSEVLSDRWWRSFDAAITREAARRGLVGMVRGMEGAVGFSALVLAGVPPLMAVLAYNADVDQLFATVESTLVFLGSFVPGYILIAGLQQGPVGTKEGRRVAARWLGARDQLADGDFARHGPAGVRVWGRHLANAAAMGLAPTAVHSLPFGAEDPRHAWSSAGGMWRPIEIAYPMWRPGWGRRPSRTLLGLVVAAVLAGSLGVALGRVEDPPIAAPAGSVPLVFAVLALIGAMFCVIDLFATRVVVGEVIRVQLRGPSLDPGYFEVFQRTRWFVAVDDGSSTRVRAWAMDAEDVADIEVGQRLRVESTPWLGYVVAYGPPEGVDSG